MCLRLFPQSSDSPAAKAEKSSAVVGLLNYKCWCVYNNKNIKEMIISSIGVVLIRIRMCISRVMSLVPVINKRAVCVCH